MKKDKRNWTAVDKGFVDQLNEVILSIGKIEFTRQEMIDELGCANFIAARTVTKELRKHSLYTPAMVFRTDPMSICRIRGIGMASLFVIMCVLDHAGFDVETWWGWKKTNAVKFSTFKHKALAKTKRRERGRGR